MKDSLNIYIVIAIVTLLASSVKGQNKDFEKIFENETGVTKTEESTKFNNISTLSFYPDTLPNWFFTPR